MNGYIKSYRKIEDNPIVCKDNDYFRVWYYLLHNATHTEYEAIFNGEKIVLKRGQLITGRKSIANKCNISESKAERILKTFKNEHQIEQQTSNKNRLISIVNWKMYQNIEQQNELQVNNNWTTSEQQLNTNNNVNNVNNVNKYVFIYSLVERTYGRTLNSVEKEMIDVWVNKEYDSKLIEEAIRISLLKHNIYLNYPNGILQNWEDKGYKTLDDVYKNERKKEEEREKPREDIFYYDWLNDDNDTE